MELQKKYQGIEKEKKVESLPLPCISLFDACKKKEAQNLSSIQIQSHTFNCFNLIYLFLN
jgi:hypothetical protein